MSASEKSIFRTGSNESPRRPDYAPLPPVRNERSHRARCCASDSVDTLFDGVLGALLALCSGASASECANKSSCDALERIGIRTHRSPPNKLLHARTTPVILVRTGQRNARVSPRLTSLLSVAALQSPTAKPPRRLPDCTSGDLPRRGRASSKSKSCDRSGASPIQSGKFAQARWCNR